MLTVPIAQAETSPTRCRAFARHARRAPSLRSQPARSRLAELLHRRCRDRVRPIRRRLSLLTAAGALALIRGREVDYARARQTVGRKEKNPARWRELLKNRALLVFAACLLLLQFADASMLPLAGERLAANYRAESELVTSALVVVPQLVSALLAAWIARKADERGRRLLLMVAFAALLARTVLFALAIGPSPGPGSRCSRCSCRRRCSRHARKTADARSPRARWNFTRLGKLSRVASRPLRERQQASDHEHHQCNRDRRATDVESARMEGLVEQVAERSP